MRSKYKVIWTNVAENDLREIIEYISIDSPGNALNIFQRLKEKTSNLYILPEKGRIVPELKVQGMLQYREWIIQPWRIIYRIAEQKVYVLSVIDSRRNVEDILLSRLVGKLNEPGNRPLIPK
jgi:toxin ParE1/3/4